MRKNKLVNDKLGTNGLQTKAYKPWQKAKNLALWTMNYKNFLGSNFRLPLPLFWFLLNQKELRSSRAAICAKKNN